MYCKRAKIGGGEDWACTLTRTAALFLITSQVAYTFLMYVEFGIGDWLEPRPFLYGLVHQVCGVCVCVCVQCVCVQCVCVQCVCVQCVCVCMCAVYVAFVHVSVSLSVCGECMAKSNQ